MTEKKFIYGVGINDLCYRTQVREELTKKWRQKNQEACFSMQILCNVERNIKKML